MSRSKTDYSCYKNPQDDQGAHGNNSGTNNQASADSPNQLYRPISDNDPVADALNGVRVR
jgi:hypothetical protein